MERLREQDARRIGPYYLVGRLDADEAEVPVPERRFIARDARGNRTVFVSVPGAGADQERFAAEAQDARRLTGFGGATVTEAGVAGELPWCAWPYVPALPLPAALAAHGGPLAE